MTENLLDLLQEEDNAVYNLRLFITGTSPVSMRAIRNLQIILDEHLHGRYDLQIIDAHQQPVLVQEENVTAVPVLIKKFPGPIRRMVGDMSDTAQVLKGLGITIEK